MDNEKLKAKSLKLSGNDIICPGCNVVMTIPDELLNDDLIQCPKCDSAINNPFFYSGKSVICLICGNNSELPKSLENELLINCNICRQNIINPYSEKYNPIKCPYCFNDIHIPEEMIHEKHIICPNCQNTFYNTFQKNTNTNLQYDILSNNNKIIDVPIKLTKEQKIWVVSIVLTFLIFITVYIGGKSTSSDPSTLYTVNTTTYVATSEASFDEMFNYIYDKDDQALSTLMRTGEILTLEPGTKVNLISSHFTHCVVRVNGSTTKLWIVCEHITKN
jgi:hypothetical protein